LEFGEVGRDCHRILTVGPGELLAWSAIIEQPRLTANARAITPALLIKISSSKLADLCDQHPAFGYQMMRRAARAMATRLTAARLQLLELHHSQAAFAAGAVC
jgi:CRP-like cAMP-binding protein